MPTNINPMSRWGVDSVTPVTSNPDTGALSSGTQGDLWIPTWSGEVLHAYDQYNMFEGMVDSRTIASGTTVEFPVTGTIALKDAWEAGVDLGGRRIIKKKFTIGLDRRPIAAHFELDNIDVMIQQFEFRSELARQAGLTLANERDRQIARLLVKGAQTGSRMHVRTEDPDAVDVGGFDSRYAGTAYCFSSDDTNVDALSGEAGALKILAAIEAELVKCRQLDIPEMGLNVVVNPVMFNQIRRLGIATVGDTTFGANGTSPLFGSQTSAPALSGSLSYMGATIVSSNHLPSGDLSADGKDANYLVDATGVEALMFARQGVASVKKQGLKVDTVEDVRRNTNFTVASMYSGAGVLRPELCSVVLGSGTLAGAGSLYTNVEDLDLSTP